MKKKEGSGQAWLASSQVKLALVAAPLPVLAVTCSRHRSGQIKGWLNEVGTGGVIVRDFGVLKKLSRPWPSGCKLTLFLCEFSNFLLDNCLEVKIKCPIPGIPQLTLSVLPSGGEQCLCSVKIDPSTRTELQVDLKVSVWNYRPREEARPFSYPKTHVVLICFAIDSPDSLNQVRKKWDPEIWRLLPGVPVFLVGLKRDLHHDPDTIKKLTIEGKRPVSQEEGEAVAREIAVFKYLECSAVAHDGVSEIFTCATRLAIDHANRNRKGKWMRRVFGDPEQQQNLIIANKVI
ncbi:P-loop containing nucleoside triphosphate hydrolase protein [Podospora fimiseda]|uniref:P-loop containing nucleoside triphosphate hydrolase protein n=1 Tax=Podospora fimiseda TaxID=252190 RepID=A0AAN6YNB1_9PEZI|nr:P-loop containing nucleoside triphosphate hydrolase protein [Podospora fimiseda]